MKRQWWRTAFAAVLLALACGAAPAWDSNNQKHDKGEKGENRGQIKKHYRQFQANQRLYARTYYGQNQNVEAFRHDNRWNNDFDIWLQPGYVLDQNMQRMSRPAPDAMIRGLGRAPGGYRYIVIGGRLVLVDSQYRVHDTIRLELYFGR
jgi:hypothetical protein